MQSDLSHQIVLKKHLPSVKLNYFFDRHIKTIRVTKQNKSEAKTNFLQNSVIGRNTYDLLYRMIYSTSPLRVKKIDIKNANPCATLRAFFNTTNLFFISAHLQFQSL